MAKDAVATMGTILTDDVGGRDAVHVAVVAVAAGSMFSPGQHVSLSPDRSTAVTGDDPIGIVDPFLDRRVQRGERFWLYLYPRTITSLCHNWTHPAFADSAAAAAYNPPSQKLMSEKWLRDFLGRSDCPDYETVLALAVNNDEDDYLLVRGSDAHGEIPPEFWEHVEIVIGRKITKRPSFFSCSC